MIARLRGPRGLKADKPARPSGFILSPLAQRSAVGETCTLGLLGCANSTGQIALARIPLTRLLKGDAATDLAAVYACPQCAATLRRTTALGYAYNDTSLLRALIETQRRMASKGLLGFGRPT